MPLSLMTGPPLLLSIRYEQSTLRVCPQQTSRKQKPSFAASHIPKPKLAAPVPERFDKYCTSPSAASVEDHKSDFAFRTLDAPPPPPQTRTTCARVVNCSLEPARSPHRRNCSSVPRGLQQPPQSPVAPVSPSKKKIRVVAPSAKSAFRFVPTYFKPDCAKQHKIDADIVTALASFRRQKIGTTARRGKRQSATNLAECVSATSTGVGSYRNSVKLDPANS